LKEDPRAVFSQNGPSRFVEPPKIGFSMKEATDFETQRNDICSATERLIARRPFLEPILQPYAAFYIQRFYLVEKLENAGSDNLVVPDPERLERGLPLIDGENVKGMKSSLDVCFLEIVAVLRSQFPAIEKQIDLLAGLDRQEKLGELAGAYLRGDTVPIEAIAAMRGVDLGVLNLLLHCTLGPVLARVALTAGIKCDDFGVNEGTCPVCGFLPAVSSLSPAGDLGSEFLRGGGGQRWLHCALCGFAWRIARGKCTVCGNQDPDNHRVY